MDAKARFLADREKLLAKAKSRAAGIADEEEYELPAWSTNKAEKRESLLSRDAMEVAVSFHSMCLFIHQL